MGGETGRLFVGACTGILLGFNGSVLAQGELEVRGERSGEDDFKKIN